MHYNHRLTTMQAGWLQKTALFVLRGSNEASDTLIKTSVCLIVSQA
jgi:hypothetical protein